MQNSKFSRHQLRSFLYPTYFSRLQRISVYNITNVSHKTLQFSPLIHRTVHNIHNAYT
jgi:hypothetical protein